LRKSLVLLTALLTVLAAAVAATAAIPDASGVIHGCRNTKTGILRVIDTDKSQTCSKDETALTWNQTGPQGPVGPEGPQGPVGSGPVTRYNARGETYVGPARPTVWGHFLHVQVNCEPGQVAVGGGATASYFDSTAGVDRPIAAPYHSVPTTNPNGWEFIWNVTTDPSLTYTATGQAVCVDGSAG